MRVSFWIIALVAAAVGVYAFADFGGIMAWAVDAQRGFQNQMATAVRALKTGEPGAYVALLSATAAYGFVHALGPGHGKYLVGGVGFGTSVSVMRLVGLAVASSLAQALWAIVLVFGGFYLLDINAARMSDLAETVFAPASYLAIACVGALIVWRGARALARRHTRQRHTHQRHTHDCGCHGHAHGPTAEEAADITTLREAVALILSVAIRPCTGAVFLLVIAWQMDIRLAGALAVITMGLGTAALTTSVAVSATAARRVALATSSSVLGSIHAALPALQVFTGVLIMIISLALLGLMPRL